MKKEREILKTPGFTPVIDVNSAKNKLLNHYIFSVDDSFGEITGAISVLTFKGPVLQVSVCEMTETFNFVSDSAIFLMV